MLRRVAVLAALLSPLGAAAQTAGTITFTVDGNSATAIGPTDCAGGTSFSATWSFVMNSATVTPTSTTPYDLLVATTSFSASTCSAATAPTAAFVPGESGAVANLVTPASTTGVQQTWPQTGTVTPGAVVTAAKASCSADGNLYFCARLYQSATVGTVIGYAIGSLAIQVTAPAAPASLVAIPGDTVLHLSWQPGTPATATPDHYKVVATATRVCSATVTAPCDPAPGVHTYDGITGTTFVADHLVNDVPYTVVVYAVSAGGLTSVASAPATATPVKVNDFWELYSGKDLGRETGGCSTGAGGLLALVGAAAALRRARRRP